MVKYVFVTGGVISSVGKGVVAASLGKILQERGIKIGIQKLDPYINVDPGTMSPYQHGEVFVTHDGAETDLDLGHYERFLGINLQRSCSVTSGQIYARVIERERKGEYLGRTIQVIPHITQEIKRAIQHAAQTLACEVLIVEVGGTVGDVEEAPFLEALRELRFELGRENTLFVHVSWLPYVQATQELKTKPSQHSLRALRSIGIIPDVVVARADHPIERSLCEKLAHAESIHPSHVFPLSTERITYKVPLILEREGLGECVVKQLCLEKRQKTPDWSAWQQLIERIEAPAEKTITVALVGKYVELHDSYISVTESLYHAARHARAQVVIKWIHAEQVTEATVDELLSGCDGIVVPGGFGARAVEGKICAARWARLNKKPYLGLCLGMQVLCIELARAVLGATANSCEIDETTSIPVVTMMNEQREVTRKGGTMRLGMYPCKIVLGTKTAQVYGIKDLEHDTVEERHRHRYEFNNAYRQQLQDAGLIISGQSPDGSLVEIVELKGHPFMVASQFHPEFLSRPYKPHPLFQGFIDACCTLQK